MNTLEAMQLLCQGKKIRKINWDKQLYVVLRDGRVLFPDNIELKHLDLKLDKWEEYVPTGPAWNFNVGEKIRYRKAAPPIYEIVYINENYLCCHDEDKFPWTITKEEYFSMLHKYIQKVV
jgi:hypothetical protein